MLFFVISFITIFTTCSMTLYFSYHDTMKNTPIYYYINMATLILIIISVGNLLITLLITSCYNHTSSFVTELNKGRFILGFFEHDSIIRRVIFIPIMNSAINLLAVVSCIFHIMIFQME